jgi:soluble calcium-activated nucleotidase 1
VSKNEFVFAAITDQDTASKDPSSTLEKPKFQSVLLPGILKRDIETGKYIIEFQEERTLTTKHNEAGRGAEYSDLQIFDNRLLTFDDRTGDVVEILNDLDGRTSSVAPRFVFTEGYGHSDKGKFFAKQIY